MRTCLIIGNAENFREDIKQVRKLPVKIDFTIAVKRTIYQYGGEVDVFATLHPEWAVDHIRYRFEENFPMGFDTYAPRHFLIPTKKRVELGIKDVLTYQEDWGGASGLYAVQIATQIYSFDRIILAGIPMDEQPRYGDTGTWSPGDKGIKRYRAAWERHASKFESKVRSMSGWTQHVFGEPDRHWLGASTLENRHAIESNPRLT